MVLDALLAYLHFSAIFVLFAFLTVQAVMLRRPLDEPRIRLLGRMDLWYFGAAMAALWWINGHLARLSETRQAEASAAA